MDIVSECIEEGSNVQHVTRIQILHVKSIDLVPGRGTTQ